MVPWQCRLSEEVGARRPIRANAVQGRVGRLRVAFISICCRHGNRRELIEQAATAQQDKQDTAAFEGKARRMGQRSHRASIGIAPAIRNAWVQAQSHPATPNHHLTGLGRRSAQTHRASSAMSATLNTVLERLRSLGNDKLEDLDSRHASARSWLASAVEEVARQISALAPAAKKRRLGGGAAKATAAAAAEQVGPGGGAVAAGQRQVVGGGCCSALINQHFMPVSSRAGAACLHSAHPLPAARAAAAGGAALAHPQGAWPRRRPGCPRGCARRRGGG